MGEGDRSEGGRKLRFTKDEIPELARRLRSDDPYVILGVSRDATEDEIRVARREMLAKFHPDAHGGNPEAVEWSKKITNAYDKIKEERSRQEAKPAATQPANTSEQETRQWQPAEIFASVELARRFVLSLLHRTKRLSPDVTQYSIEQARQVFSSLLKVDSIRKYLAGTLLMNELDRYDYDPRLIKDNLLDFWQAEGLDLLLLIKSPEIVAILKYRADTISDKSQKANYIKGWERVGVMVR